MDFRADPMTSMKRDLRRLAHRRTQPVNQAICLNNELHFPQRSVQPLVG